MTSQPAEPTTILTRPFSGVALRRAREDAAMSREQLAIKVGRSARTVENWEVGRDRPRSATVFAIARALRVSPSALMETDGVRRPGQEE